jgi:toxin ParE1/3/4
MGRVVYSPTADEDLFGIAEFIARDKPIVALPWLQSIREKCELLSDRPDLGEERREFGVPGCRCSTVGNYVIFFRAIGGGIEVRGSSMEVGTLRTFN